MTDDSNGVSRRDALRLAKLGALLGAGLCVVRDAEAQDGGGVLQQKVRQDSLLTVKLYATHGRTSELLKTIKVPEEASREILSGEESMIIWKFARAAGDGSVKTLFAQTVQVKLRRE